MGNACTLFHAVDEDDFLDGYFEELDAGGQVDECSVCLEPLRTFCLLPCTHKFHAGCMRQWVFKYKHNSCPLCRSSVLEATESEAESSEESEESSES